MSESYISTGKGGTSFVGPDATHLFRAVMVKSSLGLLKAGIKPTRGVTMKIALKIAGEYTGQKYKSTKDECDRARADLTVWIETMKSALPIETRE
jgi:hypothetical protein